MNEPLAFGPGGAIALSPDHEKEPPHGPAAADGALEAVLRMREEVAREAAAIMLGWRATITRPEFLPLAENLAAYLALRRHDVAALQPALSAYGLSSLGRCEGHVMANL